MAQIVLFMNLEIASNFCQLTAMRTQLCFRHCKNSRHEQPCLDTCNKKIGSGEKQLLELLQASEKVVRGGLSGQ